MPPLRSPLVRRFGLIGCAACAAQLVGGCYRAAPVDPAVRPVGAVVVLDITDAGRVNLGNQLGPSPLRVEGRLAATTDTSYTLAVTRVEGLRGESATWTGDPVTFRRADVGQLRVRRLDRGRTTVVALVAAGAVALVAALLTLVVTPGGAAEAGKGPPGPGNET